MAEKRTINVDINNNAEETEKDFKNLNDTLDDTAKANDEVNKSFDKGATFAQRYGEELEPLTTRMGEAEDRLYELALAGDTTSKEYQELLTSVGNYRKTQIQTDLAVDQAAQTMSQKLGGALTGAASGFAAVQGVMAITGSESEALEESLLKVQGAMAFQQGIQGVLDYSKSIGLASKAQKAFNLIVSLNPLAIFLTVVTSIVASVLAFTDVLDSAIQLLKDLGDAIGITNFEENKLQEERNERSRQHMENMKAEQTLRDAEIKQLEALGKSTIKLRRQQVEADKASLEATAKRLRLTNEGFQSIENLISGKEKEAELSATEIEVQAQIIALETELINLEKEEQQEIKNLNDTYADYAARRLSAARLIQDLENQILEDGVEKEVEISNVKFDRLLEDLKTNTELTAKERKRLTELYLFQQQEAENDIRNQFRQDQLEAEKEFEVVRLDEVVNEAGQMRLDALKKQADEEVDIEKNKNAEIEALDGATQEQKIAAVKNTLSTIANLAELFAGESEREQKKAFKIQKAANIAQATIDTYASAVSSYNSLSGIPVVGPVLGGAAAAAAVTAGLLNIKSISQQEFGGGVGDTPAVPSDVGGGGAPQFNVVGDSGVNQLAQLQQQPTQAYVVSGEVTTAQALDRNRVQNATL
jgi:hypothetical protein